MLRLEQQRALVQQQVQAQILFGVPLLPWEPGMDLSHQPSPPLVSFHLSHSAGKLATKKGLQAALLVGLRSRLKLWVLGSPPNPEHHRKA